MPLFDVFVNSGAPWTGKEEEEEGADKGEEGEEKAEGSHCCWRPGGKGKKGIMVLLGDNQAAQGLSWHKFSESGRCSDWAAGSGGGGGGGRRTGTA